MHKKTTLMIDDALYSEVRKRAAERGASASTIVAEALAAYFTHGKPVNKPRIKLTTASGGGWIGPVDPRSNRDLLDPLDDLPFEELK